MSFHSQDLRGSATNLGGDANERSSVVLARTLYIYAKYDRIFGDFPAQNTVCAPYIYGSAQSCVHLIYTGSARTLYIYIYIYIRRV